jgi:hypothetical protein
MARELEVVGIRGGTSYAALESERAFAAQPVDPSWAPRMEADINDAIAQANGPALVELQVECRMRQCRIRLTQQLSPVPLAQRSDAVLAFYAKVCKALGYEPRPVMLAIDASGTSTSLVYLPRRDAPD